jgi:hypothetical protein
MAQTLIFLVALLLQVLATCSGQSLTTTSPTPAPTFEPINADPTQIAQLDPGKCYFFGWGIGAPFNSYTSPDLADVESTGIVIDVSPYEIVAKSEDRYQVDSGDGGPVWVNQKWGIAQGNCTPVPFVRTRPDPPASICTLRLNAPADYDIVDAMGNRIGLFPWGEYVEITAVGQGYKVRLPDGREGYVDIPEQVLYYTASINGPCENVPVETGERPGG